MWCKGFCFKNSVLVYWFITLYWKTDTCLRNIPSVLVLYILTRLLWYRNIEACMPGLLNILAFQKYIHVLYGLQRDVIQQITFNAVMVANYLMQQSLGFVIDYIILNNWFIKLTSQNLHAKILNLFGKIWMNYNGTNIRLLSPY